MDMIREETLDTILMKIFGCESPSDTCMNALLKRVHRCPALAEDLAGPMGRKTERKIEDQG